MAKCKRMIACLLVLSICTLLLASCGSSTFQLEEYRSDLTGLSFSKYAGMSFTPVSLTEEQQMQLTGYDKVQENQFLELYFNKETTAIAVFDKKTGTVRYSNHPEIENDGQIDADSMILYRSQMYIDFMDGQTSKTIDNFSASVEKEAFKYSAEDDCLSVSYTFILPVKVDDNEFEDKEMFTVCMEYTLQDESLIVTVPTEKITYAQKNSPPLKITVLPHFGGQTNADGGYLFIPDGCGALVDFNDNKITPQSYYGPVYGRDESLDIKEKPQQASKVLLPVFGMKSGETAFFSIIEDGEAFAAVNAVRAGILSSYNEVYASFNLFSSQLVTVGNMADASKVTGTQDMPYAGTMRVRYAMLSPEDSDYSGMANYYRNYLIKTQGLTKKESSAKLNLELIGAVDKLKSFLGIQYDGMEVLTDTEGAKAIVSELKNMGVDTLNLRYTGWFNGGVQQAFCKKVKPLSQIGGKKGVMDLSAFAEKNGIGFYPNVEMFHADPNGGGYSKFKYSSKQVDQKEAKSYTYDLVSQEMKDYRYVISPVQYMNVYEMFRKSYSRLSIPSLSLSSIGSQLNADYTKGLTVDRQTSLNVSKKLLATMKEQFPSLMISTGNGYAVPYSDVVTDVPFENSRLPIVDRAVPFYQMVFHGAVAYSGSPLNKSYDYETDLLKMVEYGGIPYFQLMKADASAIKNSDYSAYCGCVYEFWKDDVAASAATVDKALKDVKNQYIVHHEAVAENVYKTTYENGVAVYVNYGTEDYQDNGVLVEGRNFAVTRGK